MAVGVGLGGLFKALLTVVAIVAMVRARHRRKRGLPDSVDTAAQDRRAAILETERRMAAYLAQRRNDDYDVPDQNAKETKR